jgi:hypothetical protein
MISAASDYAYRHIKNYAVQIVNETIPNSLKIIKKLFRLSWIYYTIYKVKRQNIVNQGNILCTLLFWNIQEAFF